MEITEDDASRRRRHPAETGWPPYTKRVIGAQLLLDLYYVAHGGRY